MQDYQIIQRDDNDFGIAFFGGDLPEDAPEHPLVFGRVFSEDDNLMIVPFQKCQIIGRQWNIQMKLPAGGLYSFEAKLVADETGDLFWARRIQMVRHFGVGDVYLLTGQSNMAGYGRDAAYDPPMLGVHLYANSGEWRVASHPLNDSTNTIYPANKEDASAVSPALSFARTLKDKLNIPIGLVQASLGGSSLSQWHPEEQGELYRGMMRRIDVVGQVKGVLWYQGCSDANEKRFDTYYGRFKRMVELWRQDLGEVPFITAQLNRWAQGVETKAENDCYWGSIRDAQRRIADDVPNVYIVPTLDLPMSDGIHNSSGANLIIGYRMAMVAMKNIYHKPGQLAPSVRACEYIDETHFKVKFDDSFEMSTMGNTAHGLDVEDKDGLIPCKCARGRQGYLEIETVRAYTLPASFHAYWRCNLPSFIIKDYVGMPMLACYDVEIKKSENSNG